MDANVEIDGSLIEACRIINEVDVINIVSLLTEEQASYFELYLAKRREEPDENMH